MTFRLIADVLQDVMADIELVRAASEFSAGARIEAGALAGIEATAALPPALTEPSSGAQRGMGKGEAGYSLAKSSDAKREGRGNRVVGNVTHRTEADWRLISASLIGMMRRMDRAIPNAHAPRAARSIRLSIVGGVNGQSPLHQSRIASPSSTKITSELWAELSSLRIT